MLSSQFFCDTQGPVVMSNKLLEVTPASPLFSGVTQRVTHGS